MTGETQLFKEADRVDFPADFLPTTTSGSDRDNLPRAVWIAASKGVIYAMLRERTGSPVDVRIDINPAQCGKFVPATGIPVMSPAEGIVTLVPGADIVVMNSNYLEEFRGMTGDRFNLIGAQDVGGKHE